jgi:hypothetical protein
MPVATPFTKTQMKSCEGAKGLQVRAFAKADKAWL